MAVFGFDSLSGMGAQEVLCFCLLLSLESFEQRRAMIHSRL